MKTAIVWFKTDLRLTDNETLVKAIAQNDIVIPVYCLDESHFKMGAFGFRKTGNFRAQFLLESLADLDAGLRALGSGLTIVSGKPEVEIPKLVQQYKARRVYAKREVAYEEKQTEITVKTALSKLRCELVTCCTSTLYHPEDLPFAIKDIPDVFTNFRKDIERNPTIRYTFGKPTEISSPQIAPADIPTIEVLGMQKPQSDERAAIRFTGGESEALKRIDHYFFGSDAIATYKETRNGMVGVNYSTKFSAWLAMGCISPRLIYKELKRYERQNLANESTYWLTFELLWRDYFRFMMEKYQSKFFSKAGIRDRELPSSGTNEKLLQSWVNGQTGVDFVDANMVELRLTGFMSNRGRQNVASYYCHELKLDWRCGAAYFEEQLIDYDVCNNWGNWAYLAGVGNDPRGTRIFNIEKQALDYDKDLVFRKLWLG